MSLDDLSKENKIKFSEGVWEINLRIDVDFKFDLSDLSVHYNEKENSVNIKEDRIPSNIVDNMLKFFDGNIGEYIAFLEKNLECFFSGKIPTKDSYSQFSEKLKNNPKKIIFDKNKQQFYKGPLNIHIEAYKQNVSFLICIQLRSHVQCAKCKRNFVIESSQKCEFCSNYIYFEYRCALNNNFLGNLRLEGASLLIFGASKYQFGCSECSFCYECAIESNKELKFNCYECKGNITICINSIDFVIKHLEHEYDRAIMTSNKGACKHYKKSFRIFKFPCCNNYFPCDICHDSCSKHKYELANLMICGLCGKQQSVKTKCSCGMNLQKSTSFWEGGKGIRDKVRMSKKDKKKYKK